MRVVIRAAARRDMVRHFGWLEAEAGTDTAERFMAASDRSFAGLAETPGLGPSIRSRNPRLSSMRKWRVDEFPAMLIFYEAIGKSLVILRVLHAAQDWWSLLDTD